MGKKDTKSFLTNKQADFAKSFAKSFNLRKARAETGIKEKTEQKIRKNNTFSKALQVPIAEVMEEVKYSVRNLFEETSRAMELAEETGNATALVNAIKLRGEAVKILGNYRDVNHGAQFFVNIQGIGDGKSATIQVSQQPIRIELEDGSVQTKKIESQVEEREGEEMAEETSLSEKDILGDLE